MEESRRRYKPDVRKAQIIAVTKQLILENGLSWASLKRISSALNITQNTLYYHFKNRQEILLETFKTVMADTISLFSIESSEDVIDFLHKSAYSIYDQTMKNPKQARLFFELLSAPMAEDFREEVQQQLSGLHNILEAAIRKGMQQGIFKEDTDAMLVGWELMSLQITTIVGSMVEIPRFISLEQGLKAVDHILDSIKK